MSGYAISTMGWRTINSLSDLLPNETYSITEPTTYITPEQQVKLCIKAIQNQLDSVAQAHGYDNIVSACSYAGYTNSFQKEAQALGVWRSLVWEQAYAYQAEVSAGTKPAVDENEAVAMMPAYTGIIS